jgi:hypothetical protein
LVIDPLTRKSSRAESSGNRSTKHKGGLAEINPDDPVDQAVGLDECASARSGVPVLIVERHELDAKAARSERLDQNLKCTSE